MQHTQFIAAVNTAPQSCGFSVYNTSWHNTCLSYAFFSFFLYAFVSILEQYTVRAAQLPVTPAIVKGTFKDASRAYFNVGIWVIKRSMVLGWQANESSGRF